MRGKKAIIGRKAKGGERNIGGGSKGERRTLAGLEGGRENHLGFATDWEGEGTLFKQKET